MSDLISRSELLNYLNKEMKQIPIDAEKYHIDSNVVDGMVSALQAFENKVKEVETAYSVEKVVEELKKKKGTYFDGITCEGTKIKINDAIEIVKQGGVSDDVCEWKRRTDDNFLHTSCNNRAGAYSDEFKYCPYCGKKMKVVE